MTLTPPKATRRSPKGEARRKELLDAALTLFSTKGYHATSLADIADHVGITQAGLLHHFENKGALVIATLDAWEQSNRDDQRESLASGKTWFEAFIHTLRHNEENLAHVRLYALLSHESLAEDHPAHAWFQSRYARLVTSMTAAMDEMFDPRKLPDTVTTTTIARGIIAVADGLRLQWLFDPQNLNRPEAMAQIFALLRPYLREAEILKFDPRPAT